MLLLLLMVLALAGCDDQQKKDHIQWELPMTAPSDPHGTQLDQLVPPAWAAAEKGTATLVFLHKTTTRTDTVELASDQEVEFKGWHVKLLGLARGLQVKSGAFIEGENVHNPAAFVEMAKGNEVVYRGWLYQEFPEMFGPDDSEWKVWLKQVMVRPAPQDGATTK
jgi:hypothetical protein